MNIDSFSADGIMNTLSKCEPDDYAVDLMTACDARAFFEQQVKESLNIDVKEFIRRVQAGEYEDTDDCSIMSLLMVLPFSGYSSEYAKK
jgi:hypothetical protein